MPINSSNQTHLAFLCAAMTRCPALEPATLRALHVCGWRWPHPLGGHALVVLKFLLLLFVVIWCFLAWLATYLATVMPLKRWVELRPPLFARPAQTEFYLRPVTPPPPRRRCGWR